MSFFFSRCCHYICFLCKCLGFMQLLGKRKPSDTIYREDNTNIWNIRWRLNRIYIFSYLDDVSNSALLHFDDCDINIVRRLLEQPGSEGSVENSVRNEQIHVPTALQRCRTSRGTGWESLLFQRFHSWLSWKTKKSGRKMLCRCRQFSVRTGALT